jgi:hypothetical protein
LINLGIEVWCFSQLFDWIAFMFMILFFWFILFSSFIHTLMEDWRKDQTRKIEEKPLKNNHHERMNNDQTRKIEKRLDILVCSIPYWISLFNICQLFLAWFFFFDGFALEFIDHDECSFVAYWLVLFDVHIYIIYYFNYFLFK